MTLPFSVSPSFIPIRAVPVPSSISVSLEAPLISAARYFRVKAFSRHRTPIFLEKPVTTQSVSVAFRIIFFVFSWTGHSVVRRKRVPICTPSAPIKRAAAIARPSEIPPAASTGIGQGSFNTLDSSAIQVIFPICPPPSIPSMTMASAPEAAIRFASFTFGTTGITLTPALCILSIQGTGFPAPVVTKETFSSQTASAISSTFGAISIRFTPKGLSVRLFAFLISSITHSVVRPPLPIIPAPPAFETAAASVPSLLHAIPP